MSLKRFAARRDSTEPDILRGLSRVGAQYLLLDTFDVLVLFRGRLTMLDCKSEEGRPTARQAALIAKGWPLRFVRTAEEALRVIGGDRPHE